MACHSPLKLCIHIAPSDYDWGEPCHPNAIMTRVLAATSWDPASPLNSCLINEGSWRQRTIGHQSRRGARAQPQPCLTLDTAPAQQAHVNLLFKCPAITFSIGNAGEKWFCFEIHPQNKVLLGLYFCLFGACLRGKQRAVTLSVLTASSDNLWGCRHKNICRSSSWESSLGARKSMK